MEPKFQSSFIPKGVSGAPTPSGVMPSTRRVSTQRDIVSLLATGIFVLSLLLALGVFGYSYFLNYRIGQMGAELQDARAALQPETVQELVDLNSRLVSTESLLKRHRIISPVFKFLESSTPKSVRYTDFSFDVTNKGLELNMKGAATSYTSLAVAADTVNKNPFLKGSVFSDLSLDDKGRVLFSLKSVIDPQLLSYTRYVESATGSSEPSQPRVTATTTVATSTGPSLPQGPATSTNPKATTTAPKATGTSTKPFGL
jgi:hypothetical protein